MHTFILYSFYVIDLMCPPFREHAAFCKSVLDWPTHMMCMSKTHHFHSHHQKALRIVVLGGWSNSCTATIPTRAYFEYPDLLTSSLIFRRAKNPAALHVSLPNFFSPSNACAAWLLFIPAYVEYDA